MAQLRIIQASVHVDEPGPVLVLMAGVTTAGLQRLVIHQGLPFTGTEHARPVALASFTKWIVSLHQQAGALRISHLILEEALYLPADGKGILSSDSIKTGAPRGNSSP